MPSLKLPVPLSTFIKIAAGTPLADPSLPSTPVSLQLPQQTQGSNFTGPPPGNVVLGSFAISADAAASVAIINSATDPDPVGYLGLEADKNSDASNGVGLPSIEAPAVFDPATAYVVLAGINVSGKMAGNFTIGAPGNLALNGGVVLDAGACMAFPNTMDSLAALTAAASQFKTVFSAAEIMALTPFGSPMPNPGQILTFGMQGDLGLVLTFTYASLAGTIAESVNAALAISGPIGFNCSAAATLNVSASVSDGYRVFAQRAVAGGTTFSIKKTQSTSLGINAGLGLKITASDSDLSNLVDSVFNQVTGVTSGTIQSLLTAAAGGGSLSAEQNTILTGILDKLQLPTVVGNGIDALNKKISALRDELKSRIEPAISAQLAYTWQRLTTDSLAVRFTISDAALPSHHSDILALKLESLLTNSPANGVLVDRLLGQSVQEFDIGYGFSFGLGSFSFKSWDSLQCKFIELKTWAAGGGWLSQFSFLGKRAYTLIFGGTTQSNYVELDASMSVPSSEPLLSDFHPSLSLAFSWKDCAFSKILPSVADHAAILGLFDSDNVVDAQQTLRAAGLPDDQTGDALVTLTLDNATLRRLLPSLGGSDYLARVAPYAMARALPFSPNWPERFQVDRRMKAYAQVFADFLQTEDLGVDTVGLLCQQYLRDFPDPPKVSSSLYDGEKDSSMMEWTAQETIRMADAQDLQQAVLTEMPACFAGLAQQTGNFREVLPACVENFSTLAAQEYGTRVFASMIIVATMLQPGGLNLLTRSVQLSWKIGDTVQTIVLKQGNP